MIASLTKDMRPEEVAKAASDQAKRKSLAAAYRQALEWVYPEDT